MAAEVVKRNPHAGEFYAELAEMLEVRNRQAAAERYFREAIRLLPRQPEPYAGLGLLLMRMGREADARTPLKEAFDADPFHVRVKNSLDVLDVLDAMQTRSHAAFPDQVRQGRRPVDSLPRAASGNRLRRTPAAVRLRAAGADARGGLQRVRKGNRAMPGSAPG